MSSLAIAVAFRAFVRGYRLLMATNEASARATVWRTIRSFRDANLGDSAAALTYYGLLSLFPGLIALVSILGLVGDPQETTRQLTDIVDEIGPSSAADTFAGPIESITANRSAAGFLLVVSLVVALWSASSYVGAFIRASNVIYETPEGRSFWKLRPLQLLLTLVMVLILALLALALVMTGPVVKAVGGAIGVSDTAVTIWDIAKWPVLLVVAITMVAILYYASPNARVRGFRWVTPGSALAVAMWILASAAFAIYVANFGSYDKTYGTLGGVVVLLIWLWLGNAALLLGHQLNAERERSLELAEGVPGAADQLQIEPRGQPDPA